MRSLKRKSKAKYPGEPYKKIRSSPFTIDEEFDYGTYWEEHERVIGICGEVYEKFQGKTNKKLGFLLMNMNTYHAEMEKENPTIKDSTDTDKATSTNSPTD